MDPILKLINYRKNSYDNLLKINPYTTRLFIVTMGPKDLGTLAHFISSLRSMPRRKKCPMTNKGNADCQLMP